MVIETVHKIDCDKTPIVPEDWRVESHYKDGIREFDESKIDLYLSKKQKGKGSYVQGKKLQEELKAKETLNANVLDYLLANPQLIPGDWKDKTVFFWGTLYHDPEGDFCVRCLCCFNGIWGCSYGLLSNVFFDTAPAVVWK